MMGLMVLLKNMALLSLILSLSLLPTSCKGARELHYKVLAEADEGFITYEMGSEGLGIEGGKHERVLRANTRDYGRYDPAPALRHPPSKLIPRA